MIFENGVSTAEQMFMEVFKNQEKFQTRCSTIYLDMYLLFAPCDAQRMNCARQLRTFAEDFNFQLNIKAVGLNYPNEEQLQQLMASLHCSVEAITEKDYRNLAGHLNVELKKSWEHTSDMKKRDKETKQKLKKVQYREYDYTNTIQCKY